jgi:hypothetical protein
VLGKVVDEQKKKNRCSSSTTVKLTEMLVRNNAPCGLRAAFCYNNALISPIAMNVAKHQGCCGAKWLICVFRPPFNVTDR